MTEKQAALKVYIIWAWMENTGCDFWKEEYPLHYELGYDEMMSGCPWCDIFFKKSRNSYCSKRVAPDCPLVKTGNCCEEGDSPFERWRRHDKLAAGDMASLAWKEYKRLGG